MISFGDCLHDRVLYSMTCRGAPKVFPWGPLCVLVLLCRASSVPHNRIDQSACIHLRLYRMVWRCRWPGVTHGNGSREPAHDVRGVPSDLSRIRSDDSAECSCSMEYSTDHR